MLGTVKALSTWSIAGFAALISSWLILSMIGCDQGKNVSTTSAPSEPKVIESSSQPTEKDDAQVLEGPAPDVSLDKETVLQMLKERIENTGYYAFDFETFIRKTIELGLSGDRDVELFIDLIDELRNRSFSFVASPGQRESSLLSNDRLSDNYDWRSVILSFVDDPAQGYRSIRPTRRIATKSIYRELAASRFMAAFGFWHSSERFELRGEISQLLWGATRRDVSKEVLLLLEKIADSYNADSQNAHPNATEPLRPIYNSSLSDFFEALPDNQTLVEIIRYDKHLLTENSRKATKVPTYTAFILTTGQTTGIRRTPNIASPLYPMTSRIREQEITRIELGPCDRIDALILDWRIQVERGVETSKVANQFAEEVWNPISEVIEEEKPLYLILDGEMQLVPWGAIPTQDGEYLIDRHLISFLPFAEYLIQTQIEGNADSTDSRRLVNKIVAVSFVGKELEYAGKINNVLSDLFTPECVDVLSGQGANKQAFVSSIESAKVIHFSTHGMYSRNGFVNFQKIMLENRKQTPRDSLLFAGLYLSPNGVQESLLTAEMVTELDMSQVELAVLSACLTGLGEPSFGEGRFALNHSFQMAGCRDVVSTLWEVDDQGTHLLMAEFYENLKNGLPPKVALARAQRKGIRGEFGSEVNLPVEFWTGFQLFGPGDRPIQIVRDF